MLALVSTATEQLFDSLGLTKLGHQLGLLMTGPRSPPKFPHSPPPARSSQKTGQEMKESSDVRLLGVNLTQQPKWIQLLVCTSGGQLWAPHQIVVSSTAGECYSNGPSWGIDLYYHACLQPPDNQCIILPDTILVFMQNTAGIPVVEINVASEP